MSEGTQRGYSSIRSLGLEGLSAEVVCELLFERSPLPIWIYDTESLQFLAVNEAAVRHYGFSRAEFLSMTVSDMHPPERLPEGRVLACSARENDEVIALGEWVHRTKDGSTVTVEATGSLFRIAGRAAIVAVLNDVTGLKQSEEDIRIRARQQEVVADLSKKALAGEDPDALFEEAVRALCTTLRIEFCKVAEFRAEAKRFLVRAVYGWERTLIGQEIGEIGKRSLAEFAFQSKEPVVFEDLATETRFVADDLFRGSHIQSGLGITIPGGKGHFGVLGGFTTRKRKFTADDVRFLESIATVMSLAIERKESERALEEAKAALESSVSERTLELNRVNRELTEQSHLLQSIVDSSPAIIYIKDLQGRYLLANRQMTQLFDRSLLGKKADDVLLAHIAAEWERNDLRVLAEGRPMEFEETLEIGATSRTYISTKFPLRNADGIAYGVGGISTDITHRKQSERSLRQMSAQLLRIKDEEARRIARELHDGAGQTLAALRMELDKLRLREGLVTSAEGKEAVQSGVELADDAIREIRTVSYLLHPPMLDEVGLAAALDWLVQGFSQRSGIAAELRVAPQLTRLPAETETALFRIVQEALGNVLRHSGSKTARVSLEQVNEEMVLEIQDEGRGIGSESLDVSVPERTGVGLSGMRERVSQLGGKFTVTSPGSGTVVRATVPVPRKIAQSNARILIADDYDLFRRGLRKLLEPHWAICGEATNGKEAVKQAQQLRPDLVLLDVSMPEMDGWQAALQILSTWPEAKIVLLTALEGPVIEREARSAGIAGFISKREISTRLLKLVDEVLANGKVSRADSRAEN